MADASKNSILDRARRFLRGTLSGEIRFDEHIRPLKIVIAPDGQLLAPVMVAMLESADTVLFLPRADDDAMQVLVTLEHFEDEGRQGHLADRWRVYHGEPDDVRWAFLHPDAVRFQGTVIDGDAAVEKNLLAAVEASICRNINQNRTDALLHFVRARVGLGLKVHTTLVGVDQYGLDVRGPFDIVRVEFVEPVLDPQRAQERIEAMISETDL